MNRMHAAVAAFGGGTVLTIKELLTGASILAGLAGSIFMALGGYYAFRLKQKEWHRAQTAHPFPLKSDAGSDKNS